MWGKTAHDHFGYSVALSDDGSTIIASADYRTIDNGAARVYTVSAFVLVPCLLFAWSWERAPCDEA